MLLEKPTVFAQSDISNAHAYGNVPKVNVIDLPEKICIEADLPGYDKNDLHVELRGQVLSIEGDKKTQTNKWTGGKYLLRELKSSAFRRTFTLGENYNRDQIKCRMNAGLLTVEIPKTDEEFPHGLEIE